jgi:hypothetical protein
MDMDKYDELLESARDYEEEDYFASISPTLSKEEEIRGCWELKKGDEEKRKFGCL